MGIIDSHSHLGMGWSELCTAKEYKELMEKLGITYALIMPQPIFDERALKSVDIFHEKNKEVYEEIEKELNGKVSFVPMISPVNMSKKEITEYIELYKPIAFKVHYRSDFSYPEMIRKDIINVLKEYDIPLIVHTDFSKENDIKSQLKNLNTSYKWFEFFRNNELKGYLTHGARLNKQVIEEINKEKNVVIGIGPDLFLSEHNSQLEQQVDYLKYLSEYVDPELLLFDIDYNWNRNKDNSMDFLSVQRVKDVWKEDSNKVLEKNSKRFFKIRRG